ncbi:MAG: CRISPR-associated helicase Cas3', partial [candidate division WOR-3 bacterium]
MEIWAKSKRDEASPPILLKNHTQDLIEAIKNLPYKKINKNIKEIHLEEAFFERLLKWAAFFHDLGKVSPKFQEGIGNSNYRIENFPKDFPNIRHNILSLFFINKEKTKEICMENENLYATFLSAIAFHHWKTDEKEYLLHINDDLKKASELLLENNNGEELAKILKKHFDGFKIDSLDVQEFISFDGHLAKQLLKEGSLISVNILPPYTLYFLPEKLRAKEELKIDLNLWILLSGLLIRADHFASLVEQKDYAKIALKDIEKVIPQINLKNEFENKFGEYFWQKKAEEFKDKNLILIAPTGIGKTEFALLWAEGEKFFYTLPMRVATNQIFERVSRYFNKSKEDREDPFIYENVGLLHSDADLYLYEKWESSKKDIDGETPRILDLSKHFSLPVNICTGDQIFPSGLKYPQYEKIYATLGYSKLIIDEVQAYDPRACAIVVKMMEDITSLGGKFLLMTATLPGFVKEYLKERGIIKDNNIIDCYDENNKIGLKIKTDLKHKIELRNKDIVEDINEIMTKAEEGKRILIVLNTIEKAEAVYKKIKEKIESKEIFLDLLHSRFTLNERKKKESNLEREFKNPKPPDEKNPKILVATQVVEASLDIDADYLFTEIAPMDSLIQRMGRVMRRIKYYEEYHQPESNVFVYIKPTEENRRFYLESGKGYVYENDILFITFCKLLEQANLNGENLNEVLKLLTNSGEEKQKDNKSTKDKKGNKKEKKKNTTKELNELVKNLIESLSNKKIDLLLKEKDK